MSKLDRFIRLDDVSCWHSRTRDLIANAETYTYAAFRESFRELRYRSRKADFALVAALYRFEREMEQKASDAHK